MVALCRMSGKMISVSPGMKISRSVYSYPEHARRYVVLKCHDFPAVSGGHFCTLGVHAATKCWNVAILAVSGDHFYTPGMSAPTKCWNAVILAVLRYHFYTPGMLAATKCWKAVILVVSEHHFTIGVWLFSQPLTPGLVLVGRDPSPLRADRKPVRRVSGYDSRPRTHCLGPAALVPLFRVPIYPLRANRGPVRRVSGYCSQSRTLCRDFGSPPLSLLYPGHACRYEVLESRDFGSLRASLHYWCLAILAAADTGLGTRWQRSITLAR